MDDTAPAASPTPAQRNRRSPNRPEPKYGMGERGFHPGSYPRVGPFEILRQRPLRKGVKEEQFREGRGFYNLADYPHKSPPEEGWGPYLAARFGCGTFKILHNNPRDQFQNRSLFFVDQEQVKRLDLERASTPPKRRSRDDDDDDDDDNDDDRLPRSRQNPPDPMSTFVEQLHQLRQAESLLRPEPDPVPPPPPPPGMGEMLARALMSNPQVMAQLAQAIVPRGNPPPTPAPPQDPQAVIVARFVREQGLTPEEAIDALTVAAIAKRERAAEDIDYSRGEPGPRYPPDGSDSPP